jgi:hypothetical protein
VFSIGTDCLYNMEDSTAQSFGRGGVIFGVNVSQVRLTQQINETHVHYGRKGKLFLLYFETATDQHFAIFFLSLQIFFFVAVI